MQVARIVASLATPPDTTENGKAPVTTTTVVVKRGSARFPLEVSTAAGVVALKATIAAATTVPAERQQLFAKAWPGALKDDVDLSSLPFAPRMAVALLVGPRIGHVKGPSPTKKELFDLEVLSLEEEEEEARSPLSAEMAENKPLTLDDLVANADAAAAAKKDRVPALVNCGMLLLCVAMAAAMSSLGQSHIAARDPETASVHVPSSVLEPDVTMCLTALPKLASYSLDAPSDGGWGNYSEVKVSFFDIV